MMSIDGKGHDQVYVNQIDLMEDRDKEEKLQREIIQGVQ